MDLTVRFWGVRGSIASPGPHTVKTGGNTPCVEVRAGDSLIVLDAGTGMRPLGDRMLREGIRECTVLSSHLHWDHIQGLPFFVPAWVPGHRIHVVGRRGIAQALRAQMTAPCFPVSLTDMKAELTFAEIEPGEPFSIGGASVRAAALNHPGGVFAYRIEAGGRSVVYATDTEHYACPDPHLVALARGADVLIYDAMYTDDEYSGRIGPTKVGWGHSTWQAAVAVAEAAGVEQLALFHHDPQRSDEDVDAIEALASKARPGAFAAREGESIVLAARPSEDRRAA
jgi:phosphoribosyl 1,2-cyclic phosphodiesterase